MEFLRIVLLCALLTGCLQPLRVGETRKITTYGIYCTYELCGIGYWHSERGKSEEINSEESSKPEAVLPGIGVLKK
jgi:hypothetical protein